MTLAQSLMAVSPRIRLPEDGEPRATLGNTMDRHDAVVKRCAIAKIEAEPDPEDERGRFLVRVYDVSGRVAVWRADRRWSDS